MTEAEVFEKLKPLIMEVLGVRAEEVRMGSILVEELGAESIDLLDLTFGIEEAFGVTLGPNEFERTVRERIPSGEYERDGVLTREALMELRKLLPEVNQEKISPGLRRTEVPGLVTVAVLVHVIERKLASQAGEAENA